MAQAFRAIYEAWLTKLENLLEQLLILSSSSSSPSENDREEECNALVARVLFHYKEFQEQKAIAASENPYLLLCPPWLTTFERSLLWFGGFRPSIVFPLAKRGIGVDLSNDQAERIEVMRAETRREEKEVEKTMATLQETVAAPSIFNLMRRYTALVNSEVSELDEAMDNLKEGMVKVLEIADALRGSTANKLAEILSPFQTVKFLAERCSVRSNNGWGCIESTVLDLVSVYVLLPLGTLRSQLSFVFVCCCCCCSSCCC